MVPWLGPWPLEVQVISCDQIGGEPAGDSLSPPARQISGGDWTSQCLLLADDCCRGEYEHNRQNVLISHERQQEWRRQIRRLQKKMRQAKGRAFTIGFMKKTMGWAFGAASTLVSIYCPPAGKVVAAVGDTVSGGLDLGQHMEQARAQELGGRVVLARLSSEQAGQQFDDSLALFEKVAQTEKAMFERLDEMVASERAVSQVSSGRGV